MLIYIKDVGRKNVGIKKIVSKITALYQCSYCGKELIKGKEKAKYSNSCGCKRNINMIKHGFAKKGNVSMFYNRWAHMKSRCFKKTNKSYKDYGGRGIIVCEYWLNFENFHSDMHKGYLEHCEQYGKKNTSIDRINNDGNYCKENCRWATSKIQNNNQRDRKDQTPFLIIYNNKKYIYKNKSKCDNELGFKKGQTSRWLRGVNPRDKNLFIKYIKNE